MIQLQEHIQERAAVTPTLTAVRYGREAVTFDRLDTAIGEYSDVVTNHGMSVDSAVVAGLLSSLPAVTKLTAQQIVSAVADMIAWLGRDLDGGAQGLRAVV